jgi:cyanophycinase
MKLPGRFFLLIAFTAFCFSISFSQQKLILVGGGKRPAAAVERFVSWSGGVSKARILIITWASGAPQESYDSIKKDFDNVQIASIEPAPFAPLDEAKRSQLMNQLKTATGIFFTGGDQNRIMDVLKDQELLKILRENYQKGVVFGGTSAGTAIMSDPMMTGEADLTKIDGTKVETREGLGLLPNAIVDQHFIKRQRENRLFGLILKNPTMLGIGIDEDAALAVKDNRDAEIIGEAPVMIIDAQNRQSSFVVHLLKNGEFFELNKRKKIVRKVTFY